VPDVLVIVPPDLAEGFRLAGARVRPAADPAAARGILLEAVNDPEAGIVVLADTYYPALEPATRQRLERQHRPVVVPIPTRAVLSPEERRRAELQELIRRAIGLRVVLGGRPGRGS